MMKFITRDNMGKVVVCYRNPEIKPKDIVQDFIFRDKILKEKRRITDEEAVKAVQLGFNIVKLNGRYYLDGNISRDGGDWFPF